MGNGIEKKIALLAVFLAMLAGLGVWITRFNPEAPHPKSPAPRLDAARFATQWPEIVAHAVAPARGRAAARYTLAEFGDFQCPQCGKSRPFLEGLLQKYPAQVNLIFIHRPFPNLHQWAIPAAQASEIAATQGKFWPMYDALYSHQNDLEPGFYGYYAAKVGLNKVGFQKAFDTGQGLDKVKAATAFSDSLSVSETPTILLHDSVRNTVTIYLGVDGTKFADGKQQYPGVKALVAQPPWVARGTSSVSTINCSNLFAPNAVVIATSTASRPRVIRTRPMRGVLWRGSNICQRPPR